MNYKTKREIRRSVRVAMLPAPTWESWNAIPECRTGCPLFVNGACCWSKGATSAGAPCVPCITKVFAKLDRMLAAKGGRR